MKEDNEASNLEGGVSTPTNTPITQQSSEAPPNQTPELSIKKPKKWIVPSLIVILFLLTGITSFISYKYYQLKKETVTSTQPATQETTSPTPTTDPTANWESYTPESGYYTFKYPQGWSIYKYEQNEYDAWKRECIEIGDLETNQLSQLHTLDEEMLKTHNALLVCYFPDTEMEESFPYTNGSEKNDTIQQVVINGYRGIRGKSASVLGIEEEIVKLRNPSGGHISLNLQTGNIVVFNQILSTLKFTNTKLSDNEKFKIIVDGKEILIDKGKFNNPDNIAIKSVKSYELSPDKSEVALLTVGSINAYFLYIFDVGTDNVTFINIADEIEWSQDSKHLAFTSPATDIGPHYFIVYDSDTKSTRTLKEDGLENPTKFSNFIWEDNSTIATDYYSYKIPGGDKISEGKKTYSIDQFK